MNSPSWMCWSLSTAGSAGDVVPEARTIYLRSADTASSDLDEHVVVSDSRRLSFLRTRHVMGVSVAPTAAREDIESKGPIPTTMDQLRGSCIMYGHSERVLCAVNESGSVTYLVAKSGHFLWNGHVCTDVERMLWEQARSGDAKLGRFTLDVLPENAGTTGGDEQSGETSQNGSRRRSHVRTSSDPAQALYMRGAVHPLQRMDKCALYFAAFSPDLGYSRSPSSPPPSPKLKGPKNALREVVGNVAVMHSS
jgi:hypothetical protein